MNKRAILTIWPGTTTSNKEGKNGFEPTYEELKHKDATNGILFGYGFEPTYEELKLLFMSWVFLSSHRF